MHPPRAHSLRAAAPRPAGRGVSRSPRVVPAGLVLAALLAAACRGPMPSPAALAATGFRTPDQAFSTFQAALGADLIDLEYRCFSSEFKRREGVSQLAWRAYRAELLSRWPALRRLSTAQIEGRRWLAEDRLLLRCRVRHLWFEVRFEVELVREDFYEVYLDGNRHLDDSLSWAGVVWIEGDADSWPPPSLVARVPLSEAVPLPSLSELRVGREWKIDVLRPLGD